VILVPRGAQPKTKIKMKKQIFLIIFAIGGPVIKSQIVFCPPGAEWNYNFGLMIGPVVNETIKYRGDTIIGQDTLKIITHRRFFNVHNVSSYPTISFLKQKGDTIFMRNEKTDNQWQVLYNFAATPGQSWTIKLFPFNNLAFSSTTTITYTITVDSIGTVNINNYNLKRLYVKYSTGLQPNCTITERIGCSEFFFNYRNTKYSDGDYFIRFLCYQDNKFGLKQFSDKPCNFVNFVGEQMNSLDLTEINIFPNPSSGVFTIRSNDDLKFDKLYVSDLCGTIKKTQTCDTLNIKSMLVDISELENGVYFLQLLNKGVIISNFKLLKTN
jgi:hypothetical protein